MPARPPMLLPKLFPEEILTEEMAGPFSDLSIHEAEARCLAGALQKRRREFAAGRFCARRVLGRLGIHNYPLLPDPEGLPLWPSGFTGCISHAPQYCAAAVARKDRCLSIGLDVEQISRVHAGLWPRLFTAAESGWLDARVQDRNEMAALLFSAKETFYKCCYPVSRTRFDFREVEVIPSLPCSTFEIRFPTRLPEDSARILPRHGSFALAGGHVATGLIWWRHDSR